MKTNIKLTIICAALGATVVSTQAYAKSSEGTAFPSQATETFDMLPDMSDVVAPVGESSIEPTNAMAGKFTNKVKHGWNSVKKGTSNLMGKRVKHMGKNTNRAGMQSTKGRENIVNFLHGGKPAPKRRHSI
jgi:hypothetical protein